MQAETRALQGQLDSQGRDASSVKAQSAMLQPQIQQSETQRQDERARAHAELKRQEEDLKREYSRRDEERTQYWENMLAQIRSDRESVRTTLLAKEEEMTRIQAELVDLRRAMETERARWKIE